MLFEKPVSAEVPVVDIENANYSLGVPVNISRGGFKISWDTACRYGWHDFEIKTLRKRKKPDSIQHFCRTCGYTVYT